MNLLEPLTLGRGACAPSRVMFGPHETNLGRGRALSERCHRALPERSGWTLSECSGWAQPEWS